MTDVPFCLESSQKSLFTLLHNLLNVFFHLYSVNLRESEYLMNQAITTTGHRSVFVLWSLRRSAPDEPVSDPVKNWNIDMIHPLPSRHMKRLSIIPQTNQHRFFRTLYTISLLRWYVITVRALHMYFILILNHLSFHDPLCTDILITTVWHGQEHWSSCPCQISKAYEDQTWRQLSHCQSEKPWKSWLYYFSVILGEESKSVIVKIDINQIQ